MNFRLFSMLVVMIVSLALVSCGQESIFQNQSKDQPEDINYNPKVIYGDDDRKDLYQVTNAMHLALADSTVALIQSSKISRSSSTVKIQTNEFGARYGLCSSEPFRQQQLGAYCSGFLVAKDIVVTAGHCISTARDCNTTNFVFGFAYKNSASDDVTTVDAGEVYNCASIIKTEVTQDGSDYAVIRLDREVVGHKPLKVRRSGQVSNGEELVVIGHPVGLPTKVADGASVRSQEQPFFVANLDTYGGNSGSAVFNAVTGEVEGILVRGETDFTSRGGCTVSFRCSDSGCRGEDVTRITQAVDFIPELEEGVEEIPELTAVSYSQLSSQSIPDDYSRGTSSRLSVDQAPMGRKVYVEVDISHTWRGDLTVDLVSPEGDRVRLHNRSGRHLDDIVGVYGDDLQSAGDLSVLSQVQDQGEWRLEVVDHARWDRGAVNSWKLHFQPE